MARTTVVVRARQCAGRSTAAGMGLSKRLGRARKAQLQRWRQREGKRRGGAHSEPMDTEGVSFGARFALAGSVVAHRARFFSRGPRDVRDGRWSDGRRARGWSTGARMVTVNVAIARDVAGWSRVG